MFDYITKSNLLLLQELLKSRDRVKAEKEKRFFRDLDQAKKHCQEMENYKDKVIEETRSQMMKQIAQLNAEIDTVRREGDVVRGELEDYKFHFHGITDTYRRDLVFKQLTSDVKEVEAIFEDCEKERAK